MQSDSNYTQILLEDLDYDIVILGTGMTEQVLGAILAKKGNKILNIDIDNQYSSSHMTLSLKEFIQLKEQKVNNLANIYKSTVFSQFSLNSQIKEMRQYNLDFQPKLLYSNSVTVDMMAQAGMDKYMDFQAIKEIFHFDNQKQKFIVVPGSKGEIFMHKDLNILDKRSMFSLLQTFVALFNQIENIDVDNNSTAEFDRNIQLNQDSFKLYQQYEKKDCRLFMDALKISKPIQDIFIFTLAQYEYNPADVQLLTNEFIKRVCKFVKSAGIHTKNPYLYTNYGTGDIAQGFARISAVSGSVFVLNNFIQINKIQKKEDGYEIFGNISDQSIKSKKIICGMEYQESLLNHLSIGFEINSHEFMMRSVFIIQIDDVNSHIQTLYNVIPGNEFLNNSNPITFLILGETTQSTPSRKLAIYVKYIINDTNQMGVMHENFQSFIQNHIFKEIHIEFLFESKYLQEKKTFFKREIPSNIIVSDYDDFTMDMDRIFDEVIKKIDQFFVEKIDQTNLFDQKVDQHDEYTLAENVNDDDQLNEILNNIDNLCKNNQSKEEKNCQEQIDVNTTNNLICDIDQQAQNDNNII